MPTALHKRDSRIVIGILESGLVRDELVMQTRFGQGFCRSQALINDVDDVLHSGSDDIASTCSAGDQEQRAVWARDDGGCDGGQRPLARTNVIRC